MWFFLVSSWPNVKKLARFQQLLIYFSFSSFLSTKWSPRLFFFSSLSLVISKFWWVYLAKLVEFTLGGYANKNFPTFLSKKWQKLFWRGEGEITIHCVIWVRNDSEGIINCKPEAEILVQSFQLVHPISLVLNPSWWVTRFHRMFSSHKMPCQVPQHNTCRYVLIMPGCFKISCMKSTEHIYICIQVMPVCSIMRVLNQKVVQFGCQLGVPLTIPDPEQTLC